MTRYGRYEDALLAKAQQLRWLNSNKGFKYMVSFQESLNDQHRNGGMPVEWSWWFVREACADGDAIYVSDDIAYVIDEARETWKPEKLLASDLFTPHGFMLFPRPIVLNDHPKFGPSAMVPVRAMVWTTIMNDEDPTLGCVWVAFLSSVHDDEMTKHLLHHEATTRIYEQHRDSELTLVHVLQMTFGHTPDYSSTVIDLDSEYVRMDPNDGTLTRQELLEQIQERARQQWTLPQVTWRIAQQFVRTKERADRPTRRALKRDGRPEEHVTVVRLRRVREGHPTDEFKGALSVRFPVRGHWRNQWYPSVKEHRQKWIHPYIKGPDDGPLQMSERVWEFTR